MTQYQILMHEKSYSKAAAYFRNLRAGNIRAGAYLRTKMNDIDIMRLEVSEFIELLVNSKRPQIFAESDLFGDGQDWNQAELTILGDIAVAVPVTVYDNGLHYKPAVHANPFSATLLYVPGALLRNGRGHPPADWDEVTLSGEIDSAAYYALYERRLLPSFLYANDVARSRNKYALITIPGLGCGQFAGKFHGQLGAELRSVLHEFLKRHARRLSNVRVVYYDPYRECHNERHEIDHISFLVRPLTDGNGQKSQLCEPYMYQDDGDDFTDCLLFSLVAWDHVSWPGNDFYVGSRATDDGVKAAATSSMAVMTGIEGSYNDQTNSYDPPNEYRTWDNVVRKNRINIQVKDNLSIIA